MSMSKKDFVALGKALRARLDNDNMRLRKQIARLGYVLRHLQNGRQIVTLTPNEMQRFRKWLRAHPGRRMEEDNIG